MDYNLYNSIKQVDEVIYTSHQALIVAGTGICRIVSPPTSSTSPGVSGYNIAFDGNYFYGCTGNNKWGRVLISPLIESLYCNNEILFCNDSSTFCNATTYIP